jgi:hypothetical protein
VMKRREFNDQLSDYHILENDSAPWMLWSSSGRKTRASEITFMKTQNLTVLYRMSTM